MENTFKTATTLFFGFNKIPEKNKAIAKPILSNSLQDIDYDVSTILTNGDIAIAKHYVGISILDGRTLALRVHIEDPTHYYFQLAGLSNGHLASLSLRENKLQVIECWNSKTGSRVNSAGVPFLTKNILALDRERLACSTSKYFFVYDVRAEELVSPKFNIAGFSKLLLHANNNLIISKICPNEPNFVAASVFGLSNFKETPFENIRNMIGAIMLSDGRAALLDYHLNETKIWLVNLGNADREFQCVLATVIEDGAPHSWHRLSNGFILFTGINTIKTWNPNDAHEAPQTIIKTPKNHPIIDVIPLDNTDILVRTRAPSGNTELTRYKPNDERNQALKAKIHSITHLPVVLNDMVRHYDNTPLFWAEKKPYHSPLPTLTRRLTRPG